MKKLVESAFFDRNTDLGIEVAMSRWGFSDYELEPGPTKKLVWVVEKEKVQNVKARMKASVKKIKASRSK